MKARALGLALDTLEALAQGAMRVQVGAALVQLWERVYGGERIVDALVSDSEGSMLGPALTVKASGRGGQYPLMFAGPHWRMFVCPWSGRARLILASEFLARVSGRDARIECERLAWWLYGEGIAWEVSRLDVCSDVAGVGVYAFSDLSTCVTRSHGASVVYDDGEHEEGSVDALAPRMRMRHREVQTITFGSASSRVQCCIYDKRAESRASGKSWQLDAARERGWDGASALTRVEFRWRGRALDEFPELHLRALDVLDRCDEWMPMLWRYATRRAVRFVTPDEHDTNRSRWEELSAEWLVVAALADERNAVKRVRCVSESVREERVKRASRDVLRGAIALACEHEASAYDAQLRLERIVDGTSKDAPELAVLACAWSTHGDLIGARVLDVRPDEERARALLSLVRAKARLRGWTDEPSRALLRAA